MFYETLFSFFFFSLFFRSFSAVQPFIVGFADLMRNFNKKSLNISIEITDNI